MRYEVPQFIEIEDKIIGPFTWKQFLYLSGGTGGSVLAWLFLPKIVAVIIITVLMILSVALAFYKYNKRPFIVLLESWFNYTVRSKLYIWKKREAKAQEPSIEQQVEDIVNPTVYVPKMSDSKLKDLTWALDIDHRNQGEVL